MTRDLALLLVRRALVLWVLVHVVVTVALALVDVPPLDTVGPGMPPLYTAVFAVDVRRRGERLLLANLGVGLAPVLLAAFVFAVAAELALGAVVFR